MNVSTIDHQQISHDIEDLEAVLARENKALTGSHTVKLTEIVVEKQTIIERIVARDLTTETFAMLGADTRATLARCRKLNEENNLMVNQRLKVVRQANSIVANHINDGSVTLYDQMGKMVVANRNTTLLEA